MFFLCVGTALVFQLYTKLKLTDAEIQSANIIPATYDYNTAIPETVKSAAVTFGRITVSVPNRDVVEIKKSKTDDCKDFENCYKSRIHIFQPKSGLILTHYQSRACPEYEIYHSLHPSETIDNFTAMLKVLTATYNDFSIVKSPRYNYTLRALLTAKLIRVFGKSNIYYHSFDAYSIIEIVDSGSHMSAAHLFFKNGDYYEAVISDKEAVRDHINYILRNIQYK